MSLLDDIGTLEIEFKDPALQRALGVDIAFSAVSVGILGVLLMAGLLFL
jgi:hypothetical protein